MAKRRMVEATDYGFKSGIVDADEQYIGKFIEVDQNGFQSQIHNVGFRIWGKTPLVWEFGEEKRGQPPAISLARAAQVLENAIGREDGTGASPGSWIDFSHRYRSDRAYFENVVRDVLDFAGVKYE